MKVSATTCKIAFVGSVLAPFLMCGFARAGIVPFYTEIRNDHRTGDNEFVGEDGTRRWFIDPLADRYQREFYERPTIQSYQSIGDGPFSTHEYFQNLDIVQGKLGIDSQFLYVAIEMFGGHKSDQGGDTLEGLKYEYGVRFSADPDGRDGFLLRTTFSDPKSSPVFGTLQNFASMDTDSDVGGRGGPLHGQPGPSGILVTKEDNPLEEAGLNGYDQVIISDGLVDFGPNKGQAAFFSRIDPKNPNIVEIAFDYTLFGLTMADMEALQYLDMQAIKGDPQDPQDYFWNDKYTKSEAGAPYFDPGGFGTQGLGNIYELDTLRFIPAPGTLVLLTIGLACAGRRRRA